MLGPEHPDVGQSLNNLAALFVRQDRHAEAEPLLKRSLAIFEKPLGPEHPRVATALNNLAVLYSDQGRNPKPSDSTSALWRSARSPWGPRIPMWRRLSITWAGSLLPGVLGPKLRTTYGAARISLSAALGVASRRVAQKTHSDGKHIGSLGTT
jgi:hypothetical protein